MFRIKGILYIESDTTHIRHALIFYVPLIVTGRSSGSIFEFPSQFPVKHLLKSNIWFHCVLFKMMF